MNEKKTIREWEQEFNLNIVDMDGFDKRDPLLFERFFTKTEFENAIAFCTVIHKRPKTKQQPKQEYVPHAPVGRRRKSFKQKVINIRSKRIWLFYAAFVLPAAASFLLRRLYQILVKRIFIPWYYPFGFCLLGLFILLLEPVTTLIAGPLFVWYLVLSLIAGALGSLYYQLISATIRKGALPPSHNPFLSSVNLFGNPMNLYFSIGKAITSSIVIAILIVCATELLRRLARTKSAP